MSRVVVSLLIGLLILAPVARADRPGRRLIESAADRTDRLARATGSEWALTVDRPGFRTRGYGKSVRTKTNSLLKAVALAAYTRLHAGRGLSASEWSTLDAMIRRSDNAAATRVINAVGLDRLRRSGVACGMRTFEPVLGLWGGSQVTAASAARCMLGLRSAIAERHRNRAFLLLRRIIPEQRWGIADAIPRNSTVHFKAGWDGRGHVIQMARVTCGDERIGLAVAADSASQTVSISRVERIARVALTPWARRGCR